MRGRIAPSPTLAQPRRTARECAVLTMADGMLGLSGFTVTSCNLEFTTRSMSSSGIEPSSTPSPSTKAPVKQDRFSKRTSTGPT